MVLEDSKIGFAVTGSFCTLEQVIPQMKKLADIGADIYPILSTAIQQLDTKFGKANQWLSEIKAVTDHSPISSIIEAEPIGPQQLLDILVVAPCSGNTLAKIASAITDNPVTMAVKAHLRNNRPVVLAIASNDGLGNNAENLGKLLNMKNIYFVPFGQDDPQGKINSIIARMDLIPQALEYALEERQIQPVLIEYKGI
ncbi:MAG: dipicolinate synthase subunit B [Bacillota bacterium]